MPFKPTAVLLGLLTGVIACPKSIWLWVQEDGHRAMVQLNVQLMALGQGIYLACEEAREAKIKTMPLLIGAQNLEM